jgi:thioesterase domain-containing protein
MTVMLMQTPDPCAPPRTVTIRTGDPQRPPLFLVHFLGGEHLSWRPLINHLGTHHPVLGLTLPDKNGVRQPFSDLRDMAAYHVEQICATQPEGPYHIAGYSSGARVALEIVQQLLASGREVGLLGPIDAGPVTLFRARAGSLVPPARARSGLGQGCTREGGDPDGAGQSIEHHVGSTRPGARESTTKMLGKGRPTKSRSSPVAQLG